VHFVVSPQGELVSLEIVNGKKIFYKAVKKAITKSFPLVPPNGIFKENIEFNLPIEFRLR